MLDKQLAEKYFDEVLAPKYRTEGKSEKEISSNRRGYLKQVLKNKSALAQLRQIYQGD